MSAVMDQDYREFLARKLPAARTRGFTVAPDDLNPLAFPFQRDVIEWALERGRAALFLDCGLGKTLCALDWSRQVCRHTGADVLVVTPLAVAQQARQWGEPDADGVVEHVSGERLTG